MLARPVSITVHAVFAVGFLATRVSTALAHPRDHAPAAEPVAAFAQCIPASVSVEQQVAARASSEGAVGGVLRICMSGVQPITILAACFVFVFWFVTVEARFEAAVLAGEDPAILPAIEGLEDFGAAVHADCADFEPLGVSG